MTYEELDSFLHSEAAYSGHDDQDILEHFLSKHECIPVRGEILFMCSHGRDFKGSDYLLQFHRRNNGKVPMHIYHFIVITYCMEGTLKYRVGKEYIELHQGDLIIFDRHVPHSVEATGENDLGLNIILNTQFMERRFHFSLPKDKVAEQFMMELINQQKNHEHYLVVHTHDDQLIQSCIKNILCEELDEKPGSRDIVQALIGVLLTHAARLKEKNTSLVVKTRKNEDLLNDMITYIRNNYASGNLQELCEHFGYETSTASRMIKSYTGKTFKTLVNEERMKNACLQLRHSEDAVYDIAARVGISNLTAFYRRFQEYTHLTPQQYRQQFQDSQNPKES